MTQTQNPEITQKHLRCVYKAGAIAAIIVVIGSIFDIIIGSSLGGDLTAIPKNAVDRFALFQVNPLLSLYYLDFLNLVTLVISFPAIFALYWAMKKYRPALSTMGMIVFIIGLTLFISNNTALQMAQLSYKYNHTTDQMVQFFLSGLGDFLIAKGSHGSAGVFFGFFFVLVSEMMISFAMLSKEIFSKWTGIIGILGTFLMLIYIFLVTFVPGVGKVAMMVSMPGGLLLMAWMVLFTIRLFKLGSLK
ncbi:MAG: hypothetical protein V1779_02190 [bacterium]